MEFRRQRWEFNKEQSDWKKRWLRGMGFFFLKQVNFLPFSYWVLTEPHFIALLTCFLFKPMANISGIFTDSPCWMQNCFTEAKGQLSSSLHFCSHISTHHHCCYGAPRMVGWDLVLHPHLTYFPVSFIASIFCISIHKMGAAFAFFPLLMNTRGIYVHFYCSYAFISNYLQNDFPDNVSLLSSALFML